jgi:hypothetical protein
MKPMVDISCAVEATSLVGSIPFLVYNFLGFLADFRLLLHTLWQMLLGSLQFIVETPIPIEVALARWVNKIIARGWHILKASLVFTDRVLMATKILIALGP